MPMSMIGAASRGPAGLPGGRAAGAVSVISFPIMVRSHSTGGDGLRPAAGLGRALLLGLAAAVAAVASAAAPAVSPAVAAVKGAPTATPGWMELERRIESAYFQQNAPVLQTLATTLAAADSASAAKTPDIELQNYYGALVAYRLALLAQADEPRAWPFTQQCYDRLNRARVIAPASAEALALQSACLALQSRIDRWRSPLAAPLSRARIDRALKLAPDNPRVLLLAALADRELPRLFGGDAQRGFVLMQRAVSAFERQRR